jgi:predicted nucleic acid-binding protein
VKSLKKMYSICVTLHNTGFLKGYNNDCLCVEGKYSLSFWNSIIVSCALNSNCTILASEDMQDGLKIGNMIINNISNKNVVTPYCI